MDLILYLTLVSVFIFSTVDSLMFHLDPNTRKCLKEEIHKGVLVTGEYEVKYYSNYVDSYKYYHSFFFIFLFHNWKYLISYISYWTWKFLYFIKYIAFSNDEISPMLLVIYCCFCIFLDFSSSLLSIYIVVISVCPIKAHESFDRFVSNFYWGTRENHKNVPSLLLRS